MLHRNMHSEDCAVQQNSSVRLAPIPERSFELANGVSQR